VYVGIFAWRYGHVPHGGNPEQRSITELEYRQAVAEEKACLIFLVDDDAPWPRSKMEVAATDRIEALRHELRTNERHIVDTFATVEELTRKVNEAVIQWEKQTGLVGKREAADWVTYRQAVLSRHQWVRLQVIAGASKDRGLLRVPLTEVFEPQLATPGAPGTEVPGEVRQYQREIYGDRPPEPDETPPVTDEADLKAAEAGEEDEAPGAEEQLLSVNFSTNPEQVLDIVGRDRAQVILGGPGSGKSTLLQCAMLRTCQAGQPDCGTDTELPHLTGEPIPFLIELRSYVLQKDTDFVSHLARRAEEFYGVPLDGDSVTAVLEKGRPLVFFDGL